MADRSPVARNTLALALLQAANLALPLLTLPYLLRVLGPLQFGAMAFAQAMLTYCVVATDYGFNLSATRRLAQMQGEPAAISRLFWNVQAAKLLLALASLAVLLLAATVSSPLQQASAVLLASAPLVLGALVFPQWFFQGLERLGTVSIAVVFCRLLSVAAVFTWVRGPEDAWIATLIQSTVLVAAGVVASAVLWRQRLVRWHAPSRQQVWAELREGWPLFTSTAAITLYTNTNAVVLGLVGGAQAVGIFNAADRVRIACQSAISPISNAAYPRAAALMGQDRAAGLAFARRIMVLQAAAGLVISVLLFALAPLIVATVMGPRYEEAVVVLRWMSPLPLVLALSNAFGLQMMLPLGMQRAFSRVLLAAGLLHLPVLLLCAHWMAPGAAIALVLTESAIAAAMAALLRRAGVRVLPSRRGST